MGVYTKEEMEEVAAHYGADNAVDVTPKAASTLDNINDQILAEKKSRDKKAPAQQPFDPETGEVIEQATDSSPLKAEEVKPTDPRPVLPTFDINAHNISTQAGVKAAAAEFIAVLTAHPQDERTAVFLGSSGVMLVQAMRTHGLALDVKKIEALGISLPPEEEKVPGFIGKKGAAA
jgi:hypothetical protein